MYVKVQYYSIYTHSFLNITPADTSAIYWLALSSASDTVPLRCKLTNECKQLVSPAISYEYQTQALNLRILASTRKQTHKYSQTNKWVLANEHVSTHKSLCEAIACLGCVCDFLESKGCTRQASSSHALLDSLASRHCSPQTRQTSITDYF